MSLYMFHISDHNTVGSNYPTGRVLNDPRKRRIYFIRETLEEFEFSNVTTGLP